MKNRLTNKNKKVQAWLFSLPPIKSCLSHKECAKNCYAVKSYRQYPPVRDLWDNNLNLAKSNLFELYDDIVRQLKTIKKRKIVRIHQSGDFISQEYVNLWETIAKEFPDFIFYGYTKVSKILDISKLDSLPNVNIIDSYVNGKLNFGDLEYVTKISEEEGCVICPATLTKDTYKCGGNCSHCFTNKNVVFKIH